MKGNRNQIISLPQPQPPPLKTSHHLQYWATLKQFWLSVKLELKRHSHTFCSRSQLIQIKYWANPTAIFVINRLGSRTTDRIGFVPLWNWTSTIHSISVTSYSVSVRCHSVTMFHQNGTISTLGGPFSRYQEDPSSGRHVNYRLTRMRPWAWYA